MIPEYQVRWRWTREQRRDLGQPLHAALRRAWTTAPTVRKMERAGIIGDVPYRATRPCEMSPARHPDFPTTGCPRIDSTLGIRSPAAGTGLQAWLLVNALSLSPEQEIGQQGITRKLHLLSGSVPRPVGQLQARKLRHRRRRQARQRLRARAWLVMD